MNKVTKRLYFDNPYQVEFKANVIGREVYEKKPALILDQTCFYPESGGQLADKGRINGVEVLDVLEKDAKILHVMRSEVESDKVNGVLTICSSIPVNTFFHNASTHFSMQKPSLSISV